MAAAAAVAVVHLGASVDISCSMHLGACCSRLATPSCSRVAAQTRVSAAAPYTVHKATAFDAVIAA